MVPNAPFLPPRLPNRSERMAVFVTAQTRETIIREARLRGERPGKVASLLLAVAAGHLAEESTGG